MPRNTKAKLRRNDWLQGALEICAQGVDQVKVAPLAKRLGVTTGSFYWHFKNRQELLFELLAYWEQEMTESAIHAARNFTGDPVERIYLLMDTVVINDLAKYDLPIWHWAQSDSEASRVFKRAMDKRFKFAAWMFEQAGFSKEQARMRGRMMVVYLMGEATLVADKLSKDRKLLRAKHAVLVAH